jgi:L-lactate utilization protein LutB
MVLRKLMVVEIPSLRHVLMPDVHHRSARVSKILRRRLTAEDRDRISGQQKAAGQKLIFVRAARVGKNS